MDNDRMLIDQLRQEIREGKITCDDIIKKLTIAIEAEYLRETPDAEFIKTCESLLWEIGTDGKQPFVSANSRYLDVITQQTRTAPAGKPSWSFTKRLAVVCAAFVLLIILTQGALRIGWFSQKSTQNEQQYVIQGHSIDVELIASSIAEHEAYDTLQTTDWDEFVDFLGFTPSILDPAALEASDMRYIAFVEPEVIMIGVRYSNMENTEAAVMTVHFFLSHENAHYRIEQDAEGEKHNICNTDVYVSRNMERGSYIWIDGSAVYYLSGEMTNETALHCIEDMIGGN